MLGYYKLLSAIRYIDYQVFQERIVSKKTDFSFER